MSKFRVTGQYFVDREGDRSRGLSEGFLNIKIINKTFNSRKQAERFVKKTFPQPEKMREYSHIEEIVA